MMWGSYIYGREQNRDRARQLQQQLNQAEWSSGEGRKGTNNLQAKSHSTRGITRICLVGLMLAGIIVSALELIL